MKQFATLILSCLLVLSGCFKSSKKGKNSEVLNIAITGEIDTLDPANSYDTISSSIIYQCYEQLFEYHYLKRPYTLQPLLAESMPTIKDNGKTYIIKIKKGIRYHDNDVFETPRYVKAQDFITQIKRLAYLPTKSNGWWLFDGKIVGLNEFRNAVGTDFSKFHSTEVTGLQAPDDHTLIIKLETPYPQMLYALAMAFASPMPYEVVKKYNNNMNDRIVGTGPYKLEAWNKLSGVKISKFKGYRESFYPQKGDRKSHNDGFLKDAGKKIPFINSVYFQIIKEDQPRWLKFRKKEIDTLLIPKDNFSTAITSTGTLSDELKNEGIRLQISTTLTYWWLAFNMEDPLLGKNKLLREAIAHAINIDRFISVFTNNIGQKANSIYPPGIPGYSPSKKLPYSYDIEKAKKLLALAGYPGGKGLPEFNYDERGNAARNRQQSQFIKSELAKIGIKIRPNLNPFPRFLEKNRSGKMQIWQGGWAMDYPDAENSLQLLISKNHAPGPNSTLFSSKDFDSMFDRLKVLEDGPEKFELMNKMEQVIHESLPWVMLYYSRNYLLYHGHLKNYRHSDLIYNFVKYLRKDN